MLKIVFIKIREIVRESHIPLFPVYALVFTNLLSIFFAIYYRWDIDSVLLLYWVQNIIIGGFAMYRLTTSENIIFPEKDRKYLADNKKIPVLAFGVQFLVINLILLVFLNDYIHISKVLYLILFPAGIFLINHIISFLTYYRNGRQNPILFKQFTTSIHIRTVPIHIFLLIGMPFMFCVGFILDIISSTYMPLSNDTILLTSTIGVIIFMIIKTFVDILGHIISHSDPKALEMLIKLNNKDEIKRLIREHSQGKIINFAPDKEM